MIQGMDFLLWNMEKVPKVCASCLKIKSGKDPEIITPKEALESLRVSQAIRESLNSGGWIELWQT